MLFLNRKLFITLEWFATVVFTPIFVTMYYVTFVELYYNQFDLHLVFAIFGSFLLAGLFSLMLVLLCILIFGQFVFRKFWKNLSIVPVSDEELFLIWAKEKYPEFHSKLRSFIQSKANNGMSERTNIVVFLVINFGFEEHCRAGTGFRKARKWIESNEEQIAWLLL